MMWTSILYLYSYTYTHIHILLHIYFYTYTHIHIYTYILHTYILHTYILHFAFLIGGYSHYGLADMTGFCPRLVGLKPGYMGYSNDINDDSLWLLLKKYKSWGSLMACSIQSNPKQGIYVCNIYVYVCNIYV